MAILNVSEIMGIVAWWCDTGLALMNWVFGALGDREKEVSIKCRENASTSGWQPPIGARAGRRTRSGLADHRSDRPAGILTESGVEDATLHLLQKTHDQDFLTSEHNTHPSSTWIELAVQRVVFSPSSLPR